MTGQMAGRVAVVTGASRGIGAAIAERFALDGAAVAVSARTVEEGDHPLPGSISTTLKAIADAGGTALPVAADLGRQEDRTRLVETVERELGPIDVLVNNAAVTYFEPVDGFEENHYRLMFEVQVRAPFELAQKVLPGMRARKRGWILNISRVRVDRRNPHRDEGDRLYPGQLGGGTVYGMCKAALERFTTGLASEVYQDAIAVNVLSPSGLVKTPGVLHHRLDRRVPPDRVEPVEYIVEAAYALCTGDPAALTGRVAYARPLTGELGLSVQAGPA